MKAPERNWDDFKGVDLHGKIALVLVNDPDFETGKGDFGGKAETYYGRWTYKYEEAARRGAIGFIVIHETGPASYGWNTVKNSNTNAVFDIIRKDPRLVHAPIEAWIQRDQTVGLRPDRAPPRPRPWPSHRPHRAVHGGDGGGKGPAGLRVLRDHPAVSAGHHRRQHQHGWRRGERAHKGRLHLRRRQADPAGRP